MRSRAISAVVARMTNGRISGPTNRREAPGAAVSTAGGQGNDADADQCAEPSARRLIRPWRIAASLATLGRMHIQGEGTFLSPPAYAKAGGKSSLTGRARPAHGLVISPMADEDESPQVAPDASIFCETEWAFLRPRIMRQHPVSNKWSRASARREAAGLIPAD